MRSGAMGVLSLVVLLVGCGDGAGPEPSGKRFQVLAEIHGKNYNSLRRIERIGESDLIVSGECDGPCAVTTASYDTFSFEPLPTELPISSDPYFFRMTKDGALKWRGSISSTGVEDVIVASSTNNFGDIAFAGQIGPESDVISSDGSKRHYSGGASKNGFVSFFDSEGIEKRTVLFQGVDGSSVTSIDWVSDDAVILGIDFIGSLILPLAGGRTATVTSRGGYDALVIKIGADGIVQWWLQVGGVGNDYPFAVRVFSDSSVKVSVNFAYSVEVDRLGKNILSFEAVGNSDLITMSLDSEGDVKWSFSSGAPTSTLYLKRFVESADSGFFAVGSYTNGSMLQGTDGKPVELVFYGRHYNSSDGYLASFDKEGRLKWATSFGGWTQDHASIVDLLPDGNLRVSGFGGRQGFSIEELATTKVLRDDAYQMDFNINGEPISGTGVVLASNMPDAIQDSLLLPDGSNIITVSYKATLNIADPDGNNRRLSCEGEGDGVILRRIEDR